MEKRVCFALAVILAVCCAPMEMEFTDANGHSVTALMTGNSGKQVHADKLTYRQL